MAQKNKEYWAKRALQREDEAALRGTKLVEQMYDQYMKAAKEIQKNIDTFILKYGQKHGMTYNQAAAYLSKKEMQEWKKSLAEYVAEIKSAADNLQKGQLTARLDALSANSSIRRLDALIGEIECILTGLCSNTEREAHKEFAELFQDSYYKKVYDIQSRVGYINQFAHLDEKTVEDVLSYPWSGANFSKRVWKNRDNLAFNLRETLASGFIQGKSRTQMAKEMSDAMGKGFSAVETLIRTESSWLHGEADQRAYAAAGVVEYEYMATLEHERTCSHCGDLDGKHFPVEKAQAGVNYPPLHPRCRCTTVEYDPDDELDWFNSGEEMPKNMSYEEWCSHPSVKIVEFLAIENKDKVSVSVAERIQAELERIPQKHRDLARSAKIKIIREGNSKYLRDENIILLREVFEEGELLHEVGHVIETRLGLYRDDSFLKVLRNLTDSIGPDEIEIDPDTFTKTVFRLKSDKLISVYQGRLYDEVPIFDENGKINPFSFADYFSEGYNEYIRNPDNLKLRNKELFDFIEGLVQKE